MITLLLYYQWNSRVGVLVVDVKNIIAGSVCNIANVNVFNAKL